MCKSTRADINDCPAAAPEHVDIVDIREQGQSLSLVASIKEGLSTPQFDEHRTFPSLLLWDERGLKYFEDVTYTSNYYLTNSEISLLEAHSRQIAQDIKPRTLLLELGSGCLRKIEILLKAIEDLGTEVDYYALDLDKNELVRTLRQLDPTRFRHVRCHGLLGTYDDGRAWLSTPKNYRRPKCVLSLGSTIGSFTREEAAVFWHAWAETLKLKGDSVIQEQSEAEEADAQIIVGLDACKDGDKVWGAYNDKSGANRRFILNTLDHANEQLGYKAFNSEDWVVKGKWDANGGRHGQYLVPLRDVMFENDKVGKGEEVLVVYSYKYDQAEEARLWDTSGLKETRRYMNADGSYGLHVLTPDQSNE